VQWPHCDLVAETPPEMASTARTSRGRKLAAAALTCAAWATAAAAGQRRQRRLEGELRPQPSDARRSALAFAGLGAGPEKLFAKVASEGFGAAWKVLLLLGCLSLAGFNAAQRTIRQRRRRLSGASGGRRRVSGASSAGGRRLSGASSGGWTAAAESPAHSAGVATPDFGTPVGTPVRSTTPAGTPSRCGTPGKKEGPVSPRPLRPADVVLVPTPLQRSPRQEKPETELTRKLSRQLERLTTSPGEARSEQASFQSPPPSSRRNQARPEQLPFQSISPSSKHSQADSNPFRRQTTGCGPVSPELRDKLFQVRRRLADFGDVQGA